ncbi:hypothetical protein BHE74_00050652 [Ensete ventricosum]|nr:hypothetical protein BHE74_00050652 [Ensete ventricosum]RZS22769.1 hypothetical protein BHM03_00055591 [Ensete ventricosum]
MASKASPAMAVKPTVTPSCHSPPPPSPPQIRRLPPRSRESSRSRAPPSPKPRRSPSTAPLPLRRPPATSFQPPVPTALLSYVYISLSVQTERKGEVGPRERERKKKLGGYRESRKEGRLQLLYVKERGK